VGLDVRGKLAERPGFGIDRALERADRYFVVISCIDEKHFGIGDELVPVLRLHVSTDAFVGIDAIYSERDDLFLQLDLGAIERLLVTVRFLVIDIGQTVIASEPIQQRVDGFPRPGNRAIDALFRKQKRSLDAVQKKCFEQGLAQRNVIRQRYELVQRGHNDSLGHEYFHQWSPA